MTSMEKRDFNVSFINHQLEVEGLEDPVLMTFITLEVLEAQETSRSNMLKTYSENSLEAEILLLVLWTMMMIFSS